MITRKYIDELTYKIIGCAIEVHKEMGPDMLEKIYEKCMCIELSLRNLDFKQQRQIVSEYKGHVIDTKLRYDILVEGLILVELKAKEAVPKVDYTILKTYMRMLGVPKGIMINFHTEHIFTCGQKTVINELYHALPEK